MTEIGPASLAGIGVVVGAHELPDALDPRTAFYYEDDEGIPPLLRSLLSETDPQVVLWRPVETAFIITRYYIPRYGDVIEGEVIEPEVAHADDYPTVVGGQPAWAENMERMVTEDDQTTHVLAVMDEAAEEETTGSRWWRGLWHRG